MGKTTKILLAFAAGQAVQLVIHGMCISFAMWDNRRIAFCVAGGFAIFFAVLMGVRIARNVDKPAHAKEKKSYLDWAKTPTEEMEVFDTDGTGN